MMMIRRKSNVTASIPSPSSSPAPAVRVSEEKLYVAVHKDFNEGESVLSWALQNSGGKKICILHVHVHAHVYAPQFIPLSTGVKFASIPEEHVFGRLKMQDVIHKYLLMCSRAGVRAEKLYIEADSVEKGIVKLILQFGIQRLVMGAASRRRYSRIMNDLMSRKAKYVKIEAYITCHILFVCDGHLIHTREGITNEEAMLKVQRPAIARSATVEPSPHPNPGSPSQNHHRWPVNLLGMTGVSTSNNVDHLEASAEEQEATFRTHLFLGSHLSTGSSSGIGINVAMTPCANAAGNRGNPSENEMQLISLHVPKYDDNQTLLPSLLEESVDYQLYNQQAKVENRNSWREAVGKSVRRLKGEHDAVDDKASTSESVYAEEMKNRKKVEAALLRERLELEHVMAEATSLRREASEKSTRRSNTTHRARALKEVHAGESKQRKEPEAALLTEKLERENIEDQRDKDRDELQHARNQPSKLERQIEESVGMFSMYKKQRDEMQIERDNALQLAWDLREKLTQSSSTTSSKFFSKFSLHEIQDATCSFDQSLKIGEGDCTIIYKGMLRHTEVAIKVLHIETSKGLSEYHHEVDILSTLRHPNLVTLIGVCPDIWTLIYEYLPNGSLEDQLNCKDNSTPLSWQTRIRIATELCSTLIFLHSTEPNATVHGDLKPANILLDANFTSKLSGFGAGRVTLPNAMGSTKATTYYISDPQNTFAYMDPVLLSRGEFSSEEPTTQSDVYSFGVVLLRLLTGKQAMGITEEVQLALDNGRLQSLLDSSAGDWPYEQACHLAHLALRCAAKYCKDRPDLGSQVWWVLQDMRASCGGCSSSVRIDSEAPDYFLCPIFQEVMQDPHVAADGFTYEAEALRAWISSGHDTSPMTNLKLANTNLVPNLALRSAIQEWQQKQKH